MPLHHQPTRTAAHPAIIRFLHWAWVYAIGCMVFSGWQIYNASPSLPFNFPRWTVLGGWLGERWLGTSAPCGCSPWLESPTSLTGLPPRISDEIWGSPC